MAFILAISFLVSFYGVAFAIEMLCANAACSTRPNPVKHYLADGITRGAGVQNCPVTRGCKVFFYETDVNYHCSVCHDGFFEKVRTWHRHTEPNREIDATKTIINQ